MSCWGGPGSAVAPKSHALGAAVARQLDALDDPVPRPLLRGLGAVEVSRRYVIPELIMSKCLPFWARVIRAFGGLARPLRHVGIFLLLHFMLLMIITGIPMTIITLPVVYPFIRKPMVSYISRLKRPAET